MLFLQKTVCCCKKLFVVPLSASCMNKTLSQVSIKHVRNITTLFKCNRVMSSQFSCSKQQFSTSLERSSVKVRGIQKDISLLSTRRIVRRKLKKGKAPSEREVFDVVAYATAEELNLDSLLKDLDEQGLYLKQELPHDLKDTLHVSARYRVDDEDRGMFFFRDGPVVFWNVPPVERDSVLKFLHPHQEDAYDPLLIEQEYESSEFAYSKNPTQLVGDILYLEEINSEANDRTEQDLQKYAFSNALALSVKLSIWEESLARYIDSIEHVLEDLKMGNKVRMSRSDVLRKTGELFTLRHLINLSSDLLDTPDFYWDRDELEKLFRKTYIHLNIPRRTKVINEKLTHCCELADLLTSHLNDKHHTRLEWMIILLITVEVLFEIIHIIERWQS